MKVYQKGFMHILLIMSVLGVLVVGGLFLFMKSKSSGNLSDSTSLVNQESQGGVKPALSKSDKTSDIEKELDATDVGSFDSDFESLDKASSSL